MLATGLLLDACGTTWAGLRAAALATERGFDGIWTWDHPAGSVQTRTAGVGVLDRAIGTRPAPRAGEHRTACAQCGQPAPRHRGHHGGDAAGGHRRAAAARHWSGRGAGTPYATEQSALGRPAPGDIARRRQVAEAIGVIRQLWTGRATPLHKRYFQLAPAPGVIGGVGNVIGGFLPPDPSPPIIVGAFGPKMAVLAGRLCDGINTGGAHPRLGDPIAAPRKAHAEAGNHPEAFTVTVVAGLDHCWVEDGSPERERLQGPGVRRLVLLTHPLFDPALIAAAGRLLPIPTP